MTTPTAAQIAAHQHVTPGNLTRFVPRVTVVPASEARMRLSGT